MYRGAQRVLWLTSLHTVPLYGGEQTPAPWATAMEESLASCFFPKSPF